MNDIMKRALTTAKVPSRLEPSGLHRADGKRPDGITVESWDVTCQDPFAPSYSAHAIREAGAVAALAEERKVAKYIHLTPVHLFSLVAVETMGVFVHVRHSSRT